MQFLILFVLFNTLQTLRYYLNLILHQKIQTIGAHKGVICSTSGFQNGALKYAKMHGIACIQVVPGETTFHTKSVGPQELNYNPCEVWGIPRICGYIHQFIDDNSVKHSLVDKKHLEYINEILKSYELRELKFYDHKIFIRHGGLN